MLIQFLNLLNFTKFIFSNVAILDGCGHCLLKNGSKLFMPVGTVSLQYVTGGMAINGTYLNTVEAFDVDKETWTTISNMNHSRSHFSSGVLGEKIFVVGG